MHNILHIFADTTHARTHVSLTRSAAHVLARAFLLFAAMVMTTPTAWADDPTLVAISSNFSADKTYTFRSNANYQMYVGNNDLLAIQKNSNANVNTDAAYRFAFVEYPESSGTYYLYNVGAESFLGHNSTGEKNNADELGTGSVAKQIYAYSPGNTSDSYCVAFTNNVVWGRQSSGGKNYYIFQINATVSLEDWSSIGGGNSININEVSDVTFSETELAAARLYLSGSYTPTTFADQSSAITLDTKSYTLHCEAGGYLVATESGIEVSTSASADDAAAQFRFMHSGSYVYLFSVAQQKYVVVSTSSLSETASEPINVYTTSDVHGYDFAFNSSSTWTDGTALGTSASTAPTKSNRFLLDEVIEYTATDYAAQNITTSNGLDVNGKVYTLKSKDGKYLVATTSGLTTSTDAPTDANGQFLFFQNPNTTSEEVYLYSVGRQKFVTATGTLANQPTTTTDQAQIYTASGVKISDDKPYLAFAFGSDWATATKLGSSLDLDHRFDVEEATLTSVLSISTVTAFAKVYFSSADDHPKVTLEDVGLSNGGVYTINSQRSTLYISSSNLSAATNLQRSNKATQFVFYPDPTDDTKVYFYNVGEEQFVTKSKSISTGKTDPIYIFLTRNENYPYALAYSASPIWGNANGQTHTDNYVVNSGTSSVSIDGWSLFDEGNQFKITKVEDATYSDEFVHKILDNDYGTGYGTVDGINAVVSDLNLQTDNKVYTLLSEAGGYLNATSSGLGSATSTSTNTQFLFFRNPSDETDTNVYLYSVGQQKFLTSSRGWTTTASDAAPVYFFYTSDAEGYTLALGLNVTWTTGPAITTTNANTTNPEKATRFLATDVTQSVTVNNYIHAKANWVGQYIPATLSELGIDANTVYTIISGQTSNSHIQLYGGTNRAGLNWNRNGNVSRFGTTDKPVHFAFVTDPQDESKIYLYSVNVGKAVTSGGQLTAIGSSLQRVYLYATNDVNYPFAIAFSDSWTADGVKNLDGNESNTNNFLMSTTTAMGSSKTWRATPVADDSYDLKQARYTLGLITPQATDLATQGLVTDGQVYNLTTKNGYKLYADFNGASACALKSSSTVTSSNADAQFVFFTNPQDDTKVYLYNVGRRGFLKSNNSLSNYSFLTANTPDPISLFSTEDTEGYDFAIGFEQEGASTSYIAATGENANLSVGETLPVGAYVKAEPVNSAIYSQTGATNLFNNTYPRSTIQALGIDTNKVYRLVTDTIATRGGDVQNRILVAYANPDGKKLDNSQSIETANNTHFAFVPDKTDKSKYYLYSTVLRSALTSSATFTTGDNVQQIYVYATGDVQYPLALSFSEDWSGNNVGIGGDGNSSANVNSGTIPNAANRFMLVEVEDTTYSVNRARAALNGWLSNAFHYKGASGRDFMANGMQNVSEVHYYYYVDTKRHEISSSTTKQVLLKLPVEGYASYTAASDVYADGSGHVLEPRAYYRWYDYKTDFMPADDRIGKQGSELSIKYDTLGRSLGYFATAISSSNAKPHFGNVGVYYNVPDSADDVNWEGDIIACDVSRYIDYNDATVNSTADAWNNKATFTHEPTLSIRYVYHILPAQKIADQIQQKLLNTVGGHSDTEWNKGILTFGAKDEKASMNLRGDLQEFHRYFFHPLTNVKKHVYYGTDDSHKIAQSDFSTDLVNAKGIEWRVYNSDQTAYRVITTKTGNDLNAHIALQTGGSVYKSSTVALNGTDWKDLDGNPITENVPTIDINSSCYIVGYLVNGENKCPFYNARLLITDNYPMSAAQLESGYHIERNESYLSSHFDAVAEFSFDNENSQQNLQATASTGGRVTNADISQEPSPFTWRQYGFVYNKLANYTALNYGWDGLSNDTRTASTTPVHGEYSLYKTYSKVARDRTYEKTNGQQTGYFLYTDASDESRIIGTQDFIGSMCTGSKLYITGWVANQAPPDTEMPEVSFNLLGVKKDADDNDISTTPIASIHSGKFENNVEGFQAVSDGSQTNTWYQVYGIFTIPAEANIEQYTDFRIAINNLCTQATGADYAVDDIQVFIDNAKVTVIQDHAPCNDGASTIPLKITANYETMKSVAKVTDKDKTVYYRFHKKDGTVLTGNYDGSNTDGKYGTATIPAVYNASDKLNSGTSTEISRYFTGVDGETDIVLAYKAFSGINVNDIFYVTLNTAGTPDDEGSWGKPTDVCSAYSSDFQIIEQNIEATGRNSVTVAVECGHEFSTTYQNFSVGITVPDQIAGGSISLNNKIPFFWFKGTEEQYKLGRTVTVDETTSTVTLQNAVTGYTSEYPGVAFYYDDDHPAKGVYTAAERELLRQYAYVPPTTKTYSATTESTVSNNTATIHYTDGSEEKSIDFTAGTKTSGLPEGVSSVHTVISHVGDVITVTVDTTYTDGRANSAKYVATKTTETTNTTDGDGNTTTTTTNTYSVSITDGGKAGLLYANASYSLYNYPVSTGTTTFLAISTVETITINDVVYRICTNPMAISVRGAQNGPGLTFGIEGVVYPSTLSYQYRTIRMGLPQMRAMGKDGKEQPGAGLLRVPISGKTWQTLAANDERLRFVKLGDDGISYVNTKEVYISETNDPTLSSKVSENNIRFCDVKITPANGTFKYEEHDIDETGMYVLSADSLWLNFYNFNTDSIHEGYEYEVQLLFVRTNVPAADANANNCSGETFLKFKIVPEYVTWNTSSSNNFNANWNNDRNWRRSTAAEIYKLDYKDYRTATGATATGTYTAPLFSANESGNKTVASSTYTKTNPVDNTEGFADHDVPQSYTPMYFTKVTIPKMGAGVPYPMMPFIQYYQSNGMVASMSNLKGNRATSEIEYDMMANYDNAYTTQNASTLSREVGTGSVQDSAFVCTVFNGNICQEIYFKPGAELRQQQFLRYQRAWVDVTFPINQWSTFATPMAQTPAGDFYVPKFSAQQTTTAFKEIHFSDKDSKMDQNGNVVANGSYGYFGKGGVNIYSRLRLPSYQRLWGHDAYEYKDKDTKYTAYDDPKEMLIYNSDDTSTESNDLKDKEYNNNRNNWSHPYNTMVSASSDEPQEYGTHLNGHGLALRFGDDYATPATVTKDGTTTDSEWKGDSVLLRLPKSDTEYEFMKPGWNATTGKTEEQPSGFTQTITTESSRPNDPWYRLGVAYNMPTYDYAAPQTITTKELSPSYLLYDLVGNPYISSISVDQFIATNESRLSKVVRNAGEDDEESYYAVWVLENDKLKEYKQGENNIIKPAQAFFVRLKEQGVTLRFTTLMEVDPTVSTGGSTAASMRYDPYRTFTVKDITDVEDVIHNDDVAVQFATPQTGVVDVTAGTKPLTRIVVYDTNGSMLRSVKAEATGTTRISGLTVGIAIVRAIATDGTAQTAKIVVR